MCCWYQQISLNRERWLAYTVAANTLCCIMSKSFRASKLCICTCIHVTIRPSIAGHGFLVLPNIDGKDMEAIYNRSHIVYIHNHSRAQAIREKKKHMERLNTKQALRAKASFSRLCYCFTISNMIGE